jgi:hypothetical protein
MPDSSYKPVFEEDSNATMCHFTPTQQNNPGGVAAALFHIHSSDSGSVLYGCSGKDPQTNLPYIQRPGGTGLQPIANPEGNGGGSSADWDAADDQGAPVYVMSKRTRTSRLDPGHRGGDSTNVNRWYAKGPNVNAKCQWVK